jgi:hypothetical protein
MGDLKRNELIEICVCENMNDDTYIKICGGYIYTKYEIMKTVPESH